MFKYLSMFQEYYKEILLSLPKINNSKEIDRKIIFHPKRPLTLRQNTNLLFPPFFYSCDDQNSCHLLKRNNYFKILKGGLTWVDLCDFIQKFYMLFLNQLQV